MNLDTFYQNLNKRITLVFVVLLFIGSSCVAVFTPPFQSPDEFEHITRAYLLGKGEIVLGAPVGQSSGGLIDTGLMRYMDAFSGLPFHADKKLTTSDTAAANAIEWSGELGFRPALGMAYYFPGIYGVHTLGLKIGELLKASVAESYHLTRVLLLFVTCLILYFAFSLYSPPIIVLALLVIPMSLFQFASASLDGIATALAIFMISAFFRILDQQESPKAGLFVLLMIAWLLIASSRLQLFSLILLPIALGILTRRYWYILSAGFGGICIIGWQLLMMKTVVDGRVNLGTTTGNIVLYYLQNPGKLVSVLVATVTDGERMRGYFSSFFGLLGWLDTPFVGKEYIYLLALTLLILLLSVHYRSVWSNKLVTLVLVTCSIGSLAIVFFAMLVTWTPHPASLIDGVQGRYFLIPAILLSYAFCTQLAIQGRLRQLVVLGLTLFLGAYSLSSTVLLVLSRYYSNA
jgi:uncharacterized membrane protein